MKVWKSALRLVVPLMLVIVAVLMSGCASSGEPTQYMREVSGHSIPAPPAGQANVVFLREEDTAYKMRFAVLNSDGQYLGDCVAGYYFITSVKPGTHLFIGWAENTDACQVTVEAGKTYFVKVAPQMGWWSAGVHFVAINTQSELRNELPDLLAESAELTVDVQAGRQGLETAKGASVAERTRRGKERWEKMQPAEKALKSLSPGDGYASWPVAR